METIINKNYEHSMCVLIPKDTGDPVINEILSIFNISFENNNFIQYIKNPKSIPNYEKKGTQYIGTLNIEFRLYENTPEEAKAVIESIDKKNILLVATFNLDKVKLFLESLPNDIRIPFCLFLNPIKEGNFIIDNIYQKLQEKDINLFDIIILKYRCYNKTDVLITILKIYLCYNQLGENVTFYLAKKLNLPKPKIDSTWIFSIDKDSNFVNFKINTSSLFKRINFYLIGPSGSGKSTLINLLLGEKRANCGTAESMTHKQNIYSHPKYPIAFYDSRGWEQGKYGDVMIKEIKSMLKNKVCQIHAVLIFFNYRTDRAIFEEVNKIIKKVEKAGIPFFYVITNCQKEDGSSKFNNLKNDNENYKGKFFIDSKTLLNISEMLNKIYNELESVYAFQKDNWYKNVYKNQVLHKFIISFETTLCDIFIHCAIKLNAFLRYIKEKISNTDFMEIMEGNVQKRNEFISLLPSLCKEIVVVFENNIINNENMKLYIQHLWDNSSKYYGKSFEQINYEFKKSINNMLPKYNLFNLDFNYFENSYAVYTVYCFFFSLMSDLIKRVYNQTQKYEFAKDSIALSLGSLLGLENDINQLKQLYNIK